LWWGSLSTLGALVVPLLLNGVEIFKREKARYLGFTGNKVNVVGWTL
jgi:hypothetical protein